jgi:hypothetical protein
MDTVRAQVQRGLPVTAASPEIIVPVHISLPMHPSSCCCCPQKTSLDVIATQLQLTEGLDDRKDAVRQTL